MMRESHTLLRSLYSVLFLLGLAIFAEACGPELVFRAYLSKSFWQPMLRYAAELADGLPAEKTTYSPYAGMAAGGGSTGLQNARDAYRTLFPDQPFGSLNWPEPTIANVRNVLLSTSVTDSAEEQELALMRCKLELRAAQPNDDSTLAQVRLCFESFLAQPKPAALTSEARGWIARTDFLRGRHASAARFYLDELAKETSNIRRERLLESLRLIEVTLQDLDEYFDTPAHALFAANRITNFENLNPLSADLITRLEKHADLFGQGAQSEALAISLMRASTRMGAPEMTLRYANRIPSGAAFGETAEYNWLVGIARFQQQDYTGAESALTRVINSKDADARQKIYAANGLVGVFAKLNRPVDQLRAALQVSIFSALAQTAPSQPDRYYFELLNTGLLGLDLDAGYLLDVQLNDSELDEYLKRFSNAPDGVFATYPQKMSALEAVRYARAVRHARHEEYSEAAQIYDQLKSPRAARMRQAVRLFQNVKESAGQKERQLEALYEYAVFLSNNEDRIFFNDTLWSGFQTSAFVSRNPDNDLPDLKAANAGLSSDEMAHYREMERRLRDEQEEYWRAYQILNEIVDKTGTTPLGKKAAERALFCLNRINTERFGREQEIQAAASRLTNWLGR